jgi:putative hemolysin
MLILLLAGAGVVLLSHLCSLAEAAFMSLPLVRARALAKIGGRTAKAVLRVKERLHNAITAIVVLNTIVNVLGTSLVNAYSLQVLDELQQSGSPVLTEHLGTLIPIALATSVVIFGEIVPKTLGERLNVGVSMIAAYPVLGLMACLRPLLWLSEKSLSWVGRSRSTSQSAEEEIAEMAAEASREGHLRPAEATVIQNVFRLNDFTTEDVMTPRIRCVMLAEDLTLEDARGDIVKARFSRLPLFAGTRDNVTGVVRRSDCLLALTQGKADATLKSLSYKAHFLPATMPVDRALLHLQKERAQIAVVVGEYGETVGLLTLEDIMEELVGEILDEKDVDERTIKRVSKGEILVHGQTEVARINHFFNVELPEERPTVAGLLLDRLGRLPKPGEVVPLEGLQLVAEAVNDRAIERVRIVKPAVAVAAERPGG